MSINKDSKHSPSVSIILLNWNNSVETIECMESLKRVTYNNFNVLIVDNGSKDDSIEVLEKFKTNNAIYPITIIRNPQNSGFAGGNNVAFDYILKKDINYALILNNDTLVDPLFLEELVQTMENNQDVGMVGSAIYFYDNRQLLWFGGDTPLKWKLMDKMIASTCDLFKKEMPKEMPTITVNFVSGACMLISRKVLEETKGFDERFFLYFEDADLCLRIKKLGYKLFWNPKSKIWHKVSATTLPQLGSPRLHYYHVRNVMLLSLKHGPFWMYLYRPFWGLYTGSKQILKIIVGYNREISRARLKAVLDYYGKKFGKYN